MEQRAKALSVDREGRPDGFQPTSFYTSEVLEGGFTRLVISLSSDHLETVHKALAASLKPPLKVMYQQLTDRRSGQHPKPVSRVAVEVSKERLLTALECYRRLIYEDGRHQLWLRSDSGAQLVLEEIGVLYLYPDDPSFHEILQAQGVSEGRGESMASRDYIKVNFIAECDSEEIGLWHSLGMVEWAG